MTPHFIEVHYDGEPFSICLEQIVSFSMSKDHADSRVIMVGMEDCVFAVDESYDEIKDLIRHAGSAITKADTRLDTSHPISWDDLTKMEMIGQPVFNSNTRKWMLLIDSGSFRDWIVLLNDAGGQEKWIEHDAQKYPLYRMRKEM